MPDTNVWVTWLGRAPPGFPLAAGGRARVFVTTIVLQELWAGVRTAAERAWCERLYDLARSRGRLLVPPGPAWVLSGQALNLLARRGMGAARLRTLRNDVLLAATALAHRAAVVTGNTKDFVRIAEVLPVRVVSPADVTG